ncbi:MAG: hypothetical protein Q9159_001777 [Coniocarpon cinnabarinum]
MAYIWSTPIKRPLLPPVDNKPGQQLVDGSHELTHKEVNPAWFSGVNLQWNDENLTLPVASSPFLLEPRGTDYMNFPHVKLPKDNHGKPRRIFATNSRRGSMVVVNALGQQTDFGAPLDSKEEGLLFHVIMTTQLPSLYVRFFKRVSEKHRVEHRVFLHGNTSMRKAIYYSPETIRRNQFKEFTVPSRHQIAAQEGRLLAVSIEFGSTQARQRYLNSVGVLYGGQRIENGGSTISDRWQSHQEMRATFETENISRFDQAIRAILTVQKGRVVFMRQMAKDELPCMVRINAEYDAWCEMMQLTIDYGTFWFYKMQGQFNLNSGTYFAHWNQKVQKPPPVPHWLVTKFRAKVVRQRLIELKPLEWAAIVRAPSTNAGNVKD